MRLIGKSPNGNFILPLGLLSVVVYLWILLHTIALRLWQSPSMFHIEALSFN